MAIDLERKWNLKDKLIKQFTAAELAAYNHKRYEKEKKARLKYQKDYYQKHKEEILMKSEKRYRKKCGLKN